MSGQDLKWTDSDGYTWRPFGIKFHAAGDDKWFGFKIYAISAEHAAALLEDIKQTAEVEGEIVGEYPA